MNSGKKYIPLVLLIILAGVILMFGKKNNSKEVVPVEEPVAEDVAETATPSAETVTGENYQVVLKTEAGDITLELYAGKTPKTAENFVSLAQKGFYNNTIFHRVMKGFMIQGGDPKGDGSGGPGYTFADEPFEGEYARGTLAMANAGPDTNGSQFFIMHADYPLPKDYVIFGKVVSGLEVVDIIAEAPVEANAFGEVSKPVKPVMIKSVEIIEE